MTTNIGLVAAVIALVAAAAGPAIADGDHEHGHETFAACEPGDPARPAKAVAVTLEEKPDGTMVISPARLDVALGKQVRFEVHPAEAAPDPQSDLRARQVAAIESSCATPT